MTAVGSLWTDLANALIVDLFQEEVCGAYTQLHIVGAFSLGDHVFLAAIAEGAGGVHLISAILAE